jgi:hypothetical protein
VLSIKFWKFDSQPVQDHLIEGIDLSIFFSLGVVDLLLFGHFGFELGCFVDVLEFEDLALSLCIFGEEIHGFDGPPNHFVFGVFHDLPLDLFVGESTLGDCFFAGEVDPNVFVHGEFVKEEGLFDIIGGIVVGG